ncbi:MAG TPA: hypothetical protein VFE72_07285 [Lysobacter sp.]|nr:hypothetical protein [Lysobacter sp.]
MSSTSRFRLHWALPLLLLAGAVSAAGHDPGAIGTHWRPRGDGIDAQARWVAPDGLRIEFRCDAAEPRILLRLAGDRLPLRLPQVTLVADGIAMPYPVERSGNDVRPGFVTRIALDAPILDRMLVARAFTLTAGERSVATGVPGDALARVVRACRAHHWPRETGSSLRPARSSLRPARMVPSDAGLAKK